MTALVSLVRRREPRGVWLYKVCAILVVSYALITLFGIGAEAAYVRWSDFVVPALWLSFPVTVALVQIWRQTLLGWLLLIAGFMAVAVLLGYWLIHELVVEPWDLTLLLIAITISLDLVLNRPR